MFTPLGEIEERVTNTSAANLTQEIIQLLDSRGLKIENIVGQAYDGAANMSGVYSGVQTRIKELNPRALFVHWLKESHSSQLLWSGRESLCLYFSQDIY